MCVFLDPPLLPPTQTQNPIYKFTNTSSNYQQENSTVQLQYQFIPPPPTHVPRVLKPDNINYVSAQLEAMHMTRLGISKQGYAN